MSNYHYHQLLKYLYFEGYADTYQDAEELLESLSDNEFDILCEGTFHGKQPGRAIQIIGDRRSGSSPSFSKPNLDDMRARFRQADAEEAAEAEARQTPRLPSRGIGESEPVLRGKKKRKPGGTAQQRVATLRARMRKGEDSQNMRDRVARLRAALKKREKWGTPEAAKEEYILNYLVTEGYADSYEQAEEILIHMSDLWEETILNEAAKDQQN